MFVISSAKYVCARHLSAETEPKALFSAISCRIYSSEKVVVPTKQGRSSPVVVGLSALVPTSVVPTIRNVGAFGSAIIICSMFDEVKLLPQC